MDTVSSLNSVTQSTAETQQGGDLRDVDLDQFLQLMITELQNQDPLNPMENSEILQQISQIREISATDKLADTLTAVLDGQNLTMASNLIGKRVNALDDQGENVEGVVERVSIAAQDDEQSGRTMKLHIGGRQIDLKNVRELVTEDG